MFIGVSCFSSRLSLMALSHTPTNKNVQSVFYLLIACRPFLGDDEWIPIDSRNVNRCARAHVNYGESTIIFIFFRLKGDVITGNIENNAKIFFCTTAPILNTKTSLDSPGLNFPKALQNVI